MIISTFFNQLTFFIAIQICHQWITNLIPNLDDHFIYLNLLKIKKICFFRSDLGTSGLNLKLTLCFTDTGCSLISETLRCQIESRRRLSWTWLVQRRANTSWDSPRCLSAHWGFEVWFSLCMSTYYICVGIYVRCSLRNLHSSSWRRSGAAPRPGLPSPFRGTSEGSSAGGTSNFSNRKPSSSRAISEDTRPGTEEKGAGIRGLVGCGFKLHAGNRWHLSWSMSKLVNLTQLPKNDIGDLWSSLLEPQRALNQCTFLWV